MKLDSQPDYRFLPYIAQAISTFGRIYNGFEAHGIENIPTKGPALIVFYHGLVPLDAWYFGLQYYLQTGRLIRGMGDRWLFKTPGMAWLCRAVGGVPGHPETAVKLLNEGQLVGVSPGGVREAIKGDSNRYRLVWGNRFGFAKVALEAGVPIIPGFTENVDEAYRSPGAESPFIQNLYEKTRWPIVPILGLGALPFPVKLRTRLGEPIRPSKDDTPESLREKTRVALLDLIERYQDPKKTILAAVSERFE